MRYRHYWNQGKRRKAVCFGDFLIAMTWCQMVLPWQIICELNYAAKHWKMQACGILIFAEQLYIPIGAASIQALRTELLSKKYGIVQSMNSAGGRCHDNARCESIWARMKEELFYNRGRRSENYTIEALKTMVWRYFMSYWSNRRICSAIGGIPPAVKRRRFFSDLTIAA